MNGFYIIFNNGKILKVLGVVNRTIEDGCVYLFSASGKVLLFQLSRIDAMLPVEDTLDQITEVMGKLHPGTPVEID